ncbi:CHAP domain-containing protein [Bifidobacterium eulemuris]|nr:CHAP domain-containing protein [Bifidobacterium eulemuris]QOL35470.1 CHAP domain-containing protein [Bifidobacterium lemurum]
MRDPLQAAGFTAADWDGSVADLEAGDIVSSSGHVEFYAGDGEWIGARHDETGGITGAQSGDQTGDEIAVYQSQPDGMTTRWRLSTSGCSAGMSVGTLSPALRMKTDLLADMEATGTVSDTRYPWGQCTWWVASRRAQIGNPIPGWGNAKDWRDQAKAAGMSVDKTAKVGDVIVFQAGILGADGYYGHVAVVEKVNSDGSIEISESNAVGLGVVSVRTFTKTQLDAALSGIDFIH